MTIIYYCYHLITMGYMNEIREYRRRTRRNPEQSLWRRFKRKFSRESTDYS